MQFLSEEEFSSLLQKLEKLLEEENIPDIRRELEELHPADIARLLELLHDDDKTRTFNELDPTLSSEVLIELSDHSRMEILEKMPPQQVAEIVDELDSDDATDIVADLAPDVAKFVLKKIDVQDSQEVRALLKYPEDTAGGIMQLELVYVQAGETITQVIEKVREKKEEVEGLTNVFVVDSHRKLLGFIPLSDLVLHSPDQVASDTMQPCPVVFDVEEDQEEVAHKFMRYDIYTAPVVDKQGRLIGRITADDIFDVVYEEADEDFLKMAGTREEEIVYGSRVFKISWLRLPWLVTNLFGGLITGYLMWLFKTTLQDAMVLVTFVPVITGMGGNVGIQSSTIMVRGFALGRIAYSDLGRILYKEVRVALIMGFVCGTVVGIVAYVWHMNIMLGVVVGMAMSTAILVASLMGTLTPVFFKWVKVDPALASGPFVTTANDIVGIMIYLSIATMFLRYLVR